VLDLGIALNLGDAFEPLLTAFRLREVGVLNYCELHDTGYRAQFEQYRPVITQIEKTLMPVLMRLKCFYVSSVERKSGKSFEARGFQMMGSHPDFVESVVQFEPDTPEDIPCAHRAHIVWQESRRWTEVHPYIRYCECPTCHHMRVLVFDGTQYLDPYIGHRVTLGACAE
jgi:hypothetical protein